MHPDYHNKLLKLLAETDQHIAALREAVEQGSELLPEWHGCVEQLAELESARLIIEGKLRAE
jgi:hypothetical protein